MATSEEVHLFLQDFKVKLGVWGVVFRDDRGKNAQALLNLEITPVFREKILKELQVTDYYEGPKKKICMEERICGCLEKQLKDRKYILRLRLDFRVLR